MSLYTNDCTSSYPSIKVVKFADDTTVLGIIHAKTSNKNLRECPSSGCSARWMSPPGSAPNSAGSPLKVSSPPSVVTSILCSHQRRQECIVQTTSLTGLETGASVGSTQGKTQAEGKEDSGGSITPSSLPVHNSLTLKSPVCISHLANKEILI